MVKVIDERKPDLVQRFVPYFNITFMHESSPIVTEPTVSYYYVEADVLNANGIKFSVLQKEKSDNKSIELDITHWRFPLRIQMNATFETCKPQTTCKTFYADPKVFVQMEFRKVSQWNVTTDKAPLQLQSSRVETVQLGKFIFLKIENKEDFYVLGWADVFKKKISAIVLSIADDIIGRLRRDLDEWFDKNIFPDFAVALCWTGCTFEKTAGLCNSTMGASECMVKVIDERKPDLVQRFVPYFNITFMHESSPIVTEPTVSYYYVEADVLNANGIKFSVLQKEKSDNKSIELDITHWRFPLRIQMNATFETCKPQTTCKTFYADPKVFVQMEFRKVSQWNVTTDKAPLQLQSSRVETVQLGKFIFLKIENKEDFYVLGWADVFKKKISAIVLSIADDIIGRLRRDLDEWFDKNIFPDFAREMTCSND